MTIEQAVPIIGITATVLTGLDFLVRKWIERHRNTSIKLLLSRVDVAETARNAAIAELADVSKERDTANTKLATALPELESLQLKTAEQARLLDDLETFKIAMLSKQKTHDNRVRRALELEGKIWTQPVMAGTTPFRPLAERKTPIVSVLNLKGGVGKTTLTAYLGWALAARGYRVLLVDLDLQGSLSSLFVPNEELARLSLHDHKLLQHYLADVAEKKPAKLIDFTLPLPQLNSHSRLVATTDRLAYAELNQTVQWLLRVGGSQSGWNGRHDSRMILRRALHARGLSKRFDVILIDCPPFLNLCCANALAASDYVMTPVMPSVKSVERITPLLKRVMEVKKDVNPDLKMLGVVVNSTQERDLTPKEKDLLMDLPRLCLDVYGLDVYQFDTTIPQRVVIREAEAAFAPPDEKHPLRTTFEALAEEFLKRMPAVCRQPNERAARKAKGELR